MDNFYLSTIVLSYNNEHYILDCLKSLINQNIQNHEIIVVDDGSEDNTVSIVNEYINKYENIILIEKENEGGAIASQIGISQARGKYISIVDSDDIVAPNAYKKLIDFIENDDLDFAFGKPIKMLEGIIFKDVEDKSENSVFIEKRIVSTIEEKTELSKVAFYWNAIFLKEFIVNHDIKMPSNLFIADRVFMYKAYMKAKRIGIIPDVVYYWRRKSFSNNLSITDRTSDYSMISDRINSFNAQIGLSMNTNDEENDLSFTKGFLENSIKRLLYPLNVFVPRESLDDEVEQRKYYNLMLPKYKRYTFMMMQQKALFSHMIYNSEMNNKDKVVLEFLLTAKYQELFNILSLKDSIYNYIDDMTYDLKASLRNNTDKIYARDIIEENNKKFIIFGKNDSIKKTWKDLILRIYACTNVLEYNEIDLEYQYKDGYLYADITNIANSGQYSIHIDNTENIRPNENTIFWQGIKYNFGKTFISYWPTSGVLNTYLTNKFYLFFDNSLIRIYSNDDRISGLYLFNASTNNVFDVEKDNNGFFNIDIEKIHQGFYYILYKNKLGNYNFIFDIELSNLKKDLVKNNLLDSANRLKIEKEWREER